jgi:Tfp pilus assembly protein PilF
MSAKLARIAALGLCSVWASACADSGPDADQLTGPAAAHSADGSSTSNLPSDLDGQIRRAQLLRSQGDYQGAAASLSQLLLVTPNDPRIIGEYGKVLVQQGRSQDALTFLKRATELQPNDYMLYSALGVTYDQLGDTADAKAAYEHALQLKPGDAAVLNNYAMSRLLAGDLSAAQHMLAQASAQGASDPRITANIAMVADIQAGKGGMPYVNRANPVVGPAPAAYASVSQPQVVMQQVPADTAAGRKPARDGIAHRAPAAAQHPTAVAAKKAAPVPTLRTAADDLRADASH